MEQESCSKIYTHDTDNQMIPSTSQESCESPFLNIKLEDAGYVSHTTEQSFEEKVDEQSRESKYEPHQMSLEMNDVETVKLEASFATQEDTTEAPDSPNYVCGYCGLMYCLQEDYLHHLNIQHEFDITQAKLELIDMDNLSVPNESKTEALSINMIMRDKDKSSSNTSLNMMTHKVKKKFRCFVCEKVFSTAKQALAHLRRTHRGEKPYKCDVCMKAFTHGGDLTVHVRTHTGEKPYMCHVCEKVFAQAASLARHARTHTGGKPYKCDVCGKAFAGADTLKVHAGIHTGERPYTCDVCGKAFVRADTLKVHDSIHTGERPYTCDVCGKAFICSSTLAMHARTHTGEKPYKCDVM